MKAWLKKHLPTKAKLKENPTFRRFSGWFSNRPYLWKFTKTSVAGGIAVSLFVAFLPLPLEMLIVTLIAMAVHANLPISILSTWITNPFTLIPANYFSYKVGVWILRENNIPFTPMPELEFHWQNWRHFVTEFMTWLSALGKPYLIGLPIVSISVAVLSYLLVYLIWTGFEIITKRKIT